MEQLAMCFDEPERWLPVVDYEDYYEVSDLGRVRSLPRVIARPGNNGNTVRLSGRVLKPGYTGPRATVGLCRDGKNQTFSVHRLVARAFLGPCPEGQQVCHGPAGRRDNRLVNLSYGTPLKNNGEDKRRDGTLPTGILNGRARLTEEMVRECRIRVAAGESKAALAREFRVGTKVISKAVHGDAWRHITQPPPLPLSELQLRRRGKLPAPEPRPVPADVKQVVTVRWDASLIEAVRLRAESEGVTVSDVIRRAVMGYLEERPASPSKAA